MKAVWFHKTGGPEDRTLPAPVEGGSGAPVLLEGRTITGKVALQPWVGL